MYNGLLFLTHIVFVGLVLVACARHSYGMSIAFLGVQLIAANLFVTKQIVLFGISTTASEVFIVSGMYGVGLIQEQHGQTAARNAIWYSFAILFFFLVSAQFHLNYITKAATLHKAFTGVLRYTPRLISASLVSYLVSERVHLVLHTFLKRHGLWPRIARFWAVMGGQLIDSACFAFIGLYGLIVNIGQVILFSMIVKTMAQLPLSYFLAFLTRHIVLKKTL